MNVIILLSDTNKFNFGIKNSKQINELNEIGEIIKVVQTGYLIQDRLLRPASVVVAKKEENKKK